MSTYPNQPGQPQTYYYEPPPTNALGIAGFVVSLSGMIVCLGLICPLGLILSLIGLAKSPRGYAIAGSIIGALGSVLGVLSVLVYTGVIGAGLFNFSGYYGYTANEIDNASWEIDEHFRTNQDTLPDTATAAALISSYTDEWNNALQFQPIAGSTADYTITSAGPDYQFGTSDDISQQYTAQTQTEYAMEHANWEIDDYLSTHGRLPDVPTGNGLIMFEKDTWGKHLQYAPVNASNTDYTIASAGPDNQFGTADDISQQYTGYLHYGQPTPPVPQDLDQDDIEASFEFAAQKVVNSFPPEATLPTEEQVNEKAGVLMDAWQTPMRYAPTDNPPYYTLQSAGPDKQWGTGDDITRSYYFAPSGESDGPL